MNFGLRLSVFILACGCAFFASAQTPTQRAECEKSYAPVSGQAGKDVIWVPTPDHLVTEMLKLGRTTSSDLVYDLGAGDGKIAIAAAKEFGARAVGIEYNEKMVKLAECLVVASGVADRAKVIHGDIFKVDFSAASVVTMYLLPELNAKLIPTLLKMNPGTRVVSHSFSMGDWDHDDRITVRGADHVFLWFVPAQVEGTWTLRSQNREPLVMRLEQKYQKLKGTILDGGKLTPIQEGSLQGKEIDVRYIGPNGPSTLTGTVTGNQIAVKLSTGQTATAYSGGRSTP